MKTAMISQPMNGLSEDEILQMKEEAKSILEASGYEVINTYFEDFPGADDSIKQVPIAYLAKSIAKMACCDTVLFCKGYENARGCKIEHSIAEAYGLTILYQE